MPGMPDAGCRMPGEPPGPVKGVRTSHLDRTLRLGEPIREKSPYLCLLCIFFGYEKMSFGPKAVQKNTKNVKKKRTLDAHRNQYTFPYSKNHFENSKKNFKKTYELENKTENLKFDPRPLASPKRRRRSHLSIGNE